MELAYGLAVVDKVAASTHTDVGIELVIAHGYTPTNCYFQKHRGTWEKMIVAAVLDAAMHYKPLVQSHVLQQTM